MDKNCIISFEEALECYNSGNEKLKRLALRAFNETDLKTVGVTSHFGQSATAFDDCAKVLNIDDNEMSNLCLALERIDNSIKPLVKINLIQKALNKLSNVHFTHTKDDTNYAPHFVYYKGTEANGHFTEFTMLGNFIHNGSKYTVGYLIIEGPITCSGIGCYDSYLGGGFVDLNFALLGFGSTDIAEYFAKTYWKDVIEALFGNYVTVC